MAATQSLQDIKPSQIKPNPDNPRLIFREDQMIELMNSISEVGIKVPVSLYQDRPKFVLIDGERRWRCAKRLNLATVPALIQPKPSRLNNLLMMFNIHNVRVDWDPMPMALKLQDVINLLDEAGQPTNGRALSAVTGVPLATVRRALDLLDLPKKYQNLLLREGAKPRSEQRIKADLFIEIYKSLHAIERHTPEVLESIKKEEYIDVMVNKYVNEVIDNVVSYRNISKIARAELAGVNREDAIPVLIKLVKSKSYSIKNAFEDTVQSAYEKRDLLSKLSGLRDRLSSIQTGALIDNDTREILLQLRSEVDRLLGR